jgi:hypothetical protein
MNHSERLRHQHHLPLCPLLFHTPPVTNIETMSSSLALIPEETYILQEEGVIGAEIMGKRKVSAALLGEILRCIQSASLGL